MKKLLTTISILMFSTTLFGGFFDGVQNPNGKPGVMTIKYSYISTNRNLLYRAVNPSHSSVKHFISYDEEYQSKPMLINIKYPITNYLTIGAGVFPITATHKRGTNITDIHPEREYMLAFINLHQYDVELHLPIYKLWK